MYRLLLVDDEYLELEMLKKHVDWNALGFQVVAAAKDGAQALELSRQFRPDAVITDIKMPVMDGIELAAALRREFPYTVIIFLSGYNQFDYLKAALQVDAVDYLLKPLDLNEIPPLMQKAARKCQENRNMGITARKAASGRLRELILRADQNTSGDELIAACDACIPGGDPSGSIYLALAIICEYSFLSQSVEDGKEIIAICRRYIDDFSESYQAFPVPISDSKYLLLSRTPILPASRDWGEKDRDLWVMVCCRPEAVSPLELPSAFYILDRLRHNYVKQHPTRPVVYQEEMLESGCVSPESSVLPDMDIHMLLQYIQNGETSEIDDWIIRFFAQPGHESCHDTAVILFDFLYENLISPSRYLSEKLEGKTELYRKLFSMESKAVVVDMACRYLHRLVALICGLQNDPTQMIVGHVKEYMDQNYGDPLSIDTLAEKFYFSPNYLRSIFKKYTGETVLDYLTKVRMQRAKELLVNSHMKIGQISTAAGYSNPSYFCMLFSKYYGVTPNQFRTMQGNHYGEQNDSETK